VSIRSSTFGSIRLTGEDARKFLAQITYGRPRKAVAAALKRGRPIAAALLRDGFARLKRNKRKRVR
jgi:glycine cleavage system aminomethyltransferase T